MAIQLYRPFYLIAMAGALSTAGCQSGASWRSPSTWFAARQPDPAVIAGRTETPQMPQSPAEKYAPTALANKSNSPVGNSAVGQVPVAGQVPAPGQVAGVSSQPAYGNTTQMANTVKTTVPAPTGGLAALSNGYQIGPYGMATQPSAPTAGTPTPGTTVANQTASSVKGPNSFANPYGGTFATATSSPATAPSTALPASSAPYGSTGGGLATNPAINSTAPAASNYPALPGAAPTGPSAAMVSGPSGTVPGSLASLPYPSINSTTTAPTTSVPAGSVPAASAYPAVAPASAYAPGTTGRTTNYNFGVGSTTTTPSSGQSPTMGLPPNTATGGAPQLIR